MPVLLLVTPVPLFATLATLATATPLHVSSNKPCSLQLARVILSTGSMCASKSARSCDCPIQIALRLPAHKQTGGKPITLPRRHHAIDRSRRIRKPSSVCLPTTKLVTPRRETCLSNVPDPQVLGFKAKVMGRECFRCRECLTAWRRDALRPPAQHNNPFERSLIPTRDIFFPFFFFSSCSEKRSGVP
ncbi:hypothetical protein BGZ57DRAFT_575008 [Hyaloscypha finlandica]|nr:hypothetical protein BGZ57DRAFT_575008 [Hyaloscypha finlandica]